MNKFYTYLSIIALAALSAACEKENVKVENGSVPVGEESTISVTLNVPDPATKTSLGAKDGSTYPVYWSDGDIISLNGTAATSFYLDSGNTSARATFKVSNLSAPYNFLYGGVSGHSNQVSFPSTQNYVANGFDPAAMPMFASTNKLDAPITFYHMGALLKFSLTGSKKIDSVTLTAADSDKSLSGVFTVGTDSRGYFNGLLTPASGGASLIYSFGGHKQLGDLPFVFFVAIPAGTYEGGITLDIVDNASGHMTVKVLDSNATKTIEAGVVREFENVVYSPNKETNLIQIYDTATLQNFVSRVNGGEYTLNARLTQNAATLNASSIAASWTPIEDYKGIFDGNGKTISGLTKPMFGTLRGVVKNLTLNSTISTDSADDLSWGIFAKEVLPAGDIDDIAGLQNCTAKGSITWTPESALGRASQLGGLVGNNKGGTISGCSNEATVTFADNGTVNGNQPSIGGVVGRTQKGGDIKSQGYITSCSNSGSVVCAARFAENIYIGGVLGYQVEKAESVSGCTNSGLVKVASTASTGAALHIGGVIGLGKGTIESCSNASEGVVTTEECTVGTYLCQGGVVGRLNDDSGRVYEYITNAGTVNVAAVGAPSGRLVGGVVGRCNEGAIITRFTNSGNINYTANDPNETYIGGVVASNTKADIILENCNTTGGTLTYSGATTDGALYIGGVVGYSSRPVNNCSNAMTINITGSMSRNANQYLGYGGVIGYLTGAVLATNCTNSGAINYSQVVTDEGQTYIGGVAGALTNGEISGGGNSGTITFAGQNTKRPLSVGGIVGRVFTNSTESGYALNDNVTNSGAIVVNSTVGGSQYMYLGGLVGQHLAGNIYGTNDAPITVTELHESMMALGGIVGYLAGGTVSNATNTANGDIALNGFVSSYHSYTGGIVGIASGGSSIAAGGGTITGASNAGDSTIGSGCAIPRNNYVGGVIAYAGNTVSGASNTGNIVNNYSQTSSSNGAYHYAIGGVAGYSVASLSSCYNTGNVTNNGSTYKSEINLAGVVGISEGDLTSCSNGTPSLAGGTISNTATSGTNSIQDGQFAGVVGNNKGNTTLTTCFNNGAVINSGACASVSIGGIVAWTSAGAVYEGCYNTGNITNTGTGSNSTAGVRMGGVAGSVSGANTFTGDNTTYNYNKGVLLENSESSKVAVGGICGYTFGAASDFAYAQAQIPDGDDVDDIVVKDNTRDKVYLGGVIGMSAVTSSFDYAKNVDVDVVLQDLTMSATGQVFAGGIIGGWTASGEQTINGCTSSGWVYTKKHADKDNYYDDISVGDTPTPLWSCFGGIAGMGASGSNEGLNGGWNTITGKTFTNCSNSGRILIYGKVRSCIGGVVAYTENDPDGCVCTGNIRLYKNGGISTVGNNYHRQIVGGVVGLFTGSKISNAMYNGTLTSNSSSPQAYDGGIIGYTYDFNGSGATSIELDNCRVGGSVRSTGSGSCALMCYSAKDKVVTYTFTNCVIKKGTIVYTSGSKVTISTSVTKNDCLGKESGSATVTGDVLPSIADSI